MGAAAGTPIGFVGLGALGMVLARNLIARGHKVVGYQRASRRKLTAIGGENVDSPVEVAERCSVVMTCLPDERALHEVVGGVDGLRRANAALTIVELSTIAVAHKVAARRAIEECGGTMLDCPISGTPVAIAARGGTMFASGDRAGYDGMRALLHDLLDRVIYCGEFGFGMRYKCVANYLVSVHTCAAIEAVALAEALGLETSALIEAIIGSAASSYQFEARAAIAARREEIKPMGTTRNLLKDIDIITEESASAAFRSHLLDAVAPLFRKAVARGVGDKDTSAMIAIFDPPREESRS